MYEGKKQYMTMQCGIFNGCILVNSEQQANDVCKTAGYAFGK
jgi:hypothetical protein